MVDQYIRDIRVKTLDSYTVYGIAEYNDILSKHACKNSFKVFNHNIHCKEYG